MCNHSNLPAGKLKCNVYSAYFTESDLVYLSFYFHSSIASILYNEYVVLSQTTEKSHKVVDRLSFDTSNQIYIII